MINDNIDLTMQHFIAEAFINSEAKFRSFFEHSLDGFLLADPNKRVLAANPVACALFQLSEKQICAKSIAQLFKYAEPNVVSNCTEQNFKGNIKGEVLLQQKDGSTIQAEVKTVLFKDAHGKEYSSIIISSNSDISHRIAAEITLQKSEANLKTILNNTDIAFILVDNLLKVISFNDLARDISILQGYEKPEEGKYIMDYFPPDRQSDIRQVIDTVLEGHNMAYEAKRLEKDGSEHWYALKWISITSEEQQNLGFILSIEDISKTKFAEIEREQITAELIKRNKDLEEFTYVVSHNLRAPVANIIGLVDIISDLLKDVTGAAPAVKGLSVSINKLDGVIKDLNHVLKIREKVEEKKENINFLELMKDIELSINHLIVKRKVKINCHFETAPSIFSIKGYLYSVFFNLISNSIHYQKDNIDPVISISSFQNNEMIKLVFEDNGKGIDLEKNGGNLFALYKRIDTSVEGKGMGLFLVKSQLQALNGQIDVESELGVGTRFTITLPL